MFIFTAKLSKKKIIYGVLGLGIILCAIILLTPEKQADEVLMIQMEENIMASITVGGIKTNEDRIIFLNQKGLEVSKQEIEKKTVQIPSEFSEIYIAYNDIQKAQGFNLEKFQGKTVELYTYEVLNYHDDTQEVYVNLLVYNEKIIGGDVSSTNLDGFISGFEFNE